MKFDAGLRRVVTRVLAVAALVLQMPAFAHDVTPFEGVTAFTIDTKAGGFTRHTLYLRPTKAATTPPPAVVMLHYLRGRGDDMADLIEASRIVRDFGAWVLLPDAIAGNWNYGSGSLIGGVSALANDVSFLSDLIKTSITNYGLDPHRIYMAGYSNGGLMTMRFFVIYHDQQHHAILPKSRLAEGIMQVFGILALSPSSIWRSSHDHHHKHNSRLKSAHIGSFPVTNTGSFDIALPPLTDLGDGRVTVTANYSVSPAGTPLANTMTSDFSMPITIPPHPYITMTQSGGNLILSWNPENGSFTVQTNSSVTSPGTWGNFTAGNVAPPVSVPIGSGTRFVRLKK